MSIFCPSTGGHEPAMKSWAENLSTPRTLGVNSTKQGKEAGYLHKVQLFHEIEHSPVQAYLHSDLFIQEKGWDLRVLKEFEDPEVVMASFFGARRLGRDDLYRAPYDFRQLARADCWSNMSDAENHGKRTAGAMDVAMIDSFAVIIRREWLASIGGWPVDRYAQSHCSDMWLCCMAARTKKRVRLVGIACSHTGGGTTQPGFDYAAWQVEQGMTDSEMHQSNHRKLYDEFRDVLPIKVTNGL
jgi:hypothetical protein